MDHIGIDVHAKESRIRTWGRTGELARATDPHHPRPRFAAVLGRSAASPRPP